MNAWIDGIVKATRAVKADQESLKLQNEFFEKAAHPLTDPTGVNNALNWPSARRNLGNVGPASARMLRSRIRRKISSLRGVQVARDTRPARSQWSGEKQESGSSPSAPA